MEKLLLRIAGYADERGVPLVFAIAPSIVQVEDKLWSSTLLSSSKKKENYNRTLPNNKLMQFAKKNNHFLGVDPGRKVDPRLYLFYTKVGISGKFSGAKYFHFASIVL